MSDSHDDNHSDSELDDMMYLMSGTVKNDNDDVEEVNIGKWNMVRDYRTIVEVDGVNQHLLAIAREEVPVVLEMGECGIYTPSLQHVTCLEA